MALLTISVHDQAVQAALAALAARVAKPEPLLVAIGEGMHRRVDGRFSAQAGPDGAPWKPNAPATKRAKGNKPILTDAGDLRRSIVPQVVAGVLTLSTHEPYAAIHQFGGAIERAAYSKQVRHRTNAKGELLRSAIMNGRGLIFAKDSHKRALTRWFEVAAHKINIPARPYMPVRADGSLYADEKAAILAQINAWLAGGLTGGPAS